MGEAKTKRARFRWKRARDRVACTGYLVVIASRSSQRHNRVRSPRGEHTSRNRADNRPSWCGAGS